MVRLDFGEFVFSYRGEVRGRTGGMPRESILALGVTLSADDSMPEEGDFRLEIDKITCVRASSIRDYVFCVRLHFDVHFCQ